MKMNAIVKASPAQASNPLMPSDMRSAMDLANMMATAKLVPVHLHGKPGDCLLVIEQAVRWGMSPFAVAQATSVIQGRLMFEGKLVNAALNASGIMSSRLTYEYEGEGASRAVTASGTLRGEVTPRTIRCTLAEAKTTNGMWTKQPDQQLSYFTTRAWARRHAPEVMLGVYSPEEFDASDNFRGTTLDVASAPETVPQRIPKQPRVSEPVTVSEQPRRTYRQLIDETAGMLKACDTVEAVLAVGQLPQVNIALTKASPAVQTEIKALLADAYERVQALADDAAEAEEPEDDFPAAIALEAEAAAPV